MAFTDPIYMGWFLIEEHLSVIHTSHVPLPRFSRLRALRTLRFCYFDLSTCRVCSVKHMMIMRGYFPRLWYDPFPLHARGQVSVLF